MPDREHRVTLLIVIALFVVGGASTTLRVLSQVRTAPATLTTFVARHDQRAGTVTVTRAGARQPLVTLHAPADGQPYLHPLTTPDGKSVVTDQSGVSWGFTRLNARDYSNNSGAGYWRRSSVTVLDGNGATVRWQTVYDLLDQSGTTLLTETARWSVHEERGTMLLDLEWRGEAKADVTIGKSDHGGLFVRMASRAGAAADVVNAARQRNQRADGQAAMWIDVGLSLPGRADAAHVTLFDHPDNGGYPQPWHVDEQNAVGAARSLNGDWKITKGDTEVIRHRLAVYTGQFDDIQTTVAWNDFSGNRSTYSTSALWSIAQREGRAAAFLTPDQAVAKMTTIDGYAVNAWAAEPMIGQPMAFCWDDRGRLWVAENRDYESRGSGFSNGGDSRIVILEDTNHDGIADTRKVFLDKIVFPTALAVGFGGVFVGAPPNLLFVPDRNGDDKADESDIEVRLTGWGIQDRHETMNSLTWGPDGWLYGLQGYATSSRIRKPAGKGHLYSVREPFPAGLLDGDGVEINGGVWRYHPTKDRFEVVAHGFSNPWGIDYDAKGQLLISACVIPHLWHVIPGGIYQRQGGQHFNPYVYSDITTIADHRHRSAHGGARIYQSDAFPASQVGRIFMANIHEHAVLSDVLVRQGSGFVAHHGDDFMMANNAQWIGFSLEIGPDGAIYVLDWHDGDICGIDVLNKETGRIYRIAPKISLAADWPGRYADLNAMSDAELVALQTSRSDWHARRARVILQYRAADKQLRPDTHQRLRALFASKDSADWRLRAMWALHVTGGWTPDALVETLADPDPSIRGWAIQLLCEDGSPSARALETFARMARDDQSPVVRLYLGSALQRIDRSARWNVAAALMQHAEDANDHNLPKIVWVGVEPLVKDDPATALDHASHSRLPLVARFIARRSVDADALEPLVAALARSPANEIDLLEGMRDGLEGRFDVVAPDSWPPLAERLKRGSAPVRQVTLDIAQRFNDAGTARSNLALVTTRTAPVDERRRAINMLANQRRKELAAALPDVIDDPSLRVDGIRAVAAFDSDDLGKLLLARYGVFTSAEKMEAIQALSSRQRYSRMLTDALANGSVPKSDIPAYAARQLLRVVGPRFVDVWGPIERDVKEDRAYARYRGLLNDAAMRNADLRHGREVFQRTCAACHTLYGEGGTIGPDLTGSNRGSLEYLLSNVLDPNRDVPDAYRMTVITMRDGRTYSGNIVTESPRQLTLRVVGRENAVINVAEIQSRETTATSMMPPGLLDALSDREAVDLVAYLRTLETPKAP